MIDNAFLLFLFFSFLVENERDLPHWQHRREFRFDLSGIPDGEVITGAEFRIYKQFTRERFDNQTFRVGLYQVLQESTNRSVPFWSKLIRTLSQRWLLPPCLYYTPLTNISTGVSINAGHVYTDISVNYRMAVFSPEQVYTNTLRLQSLDLRTLSDV